MESRKLKRFIPRPFLLSLLFVSMAGLVSAQAEWSGPAAASPGLASADAVSTSEFSLRFLAGINLYRESSWLEAAAELRAAQELAETRREWAEALYWVVLSELAASDYGSALRDMDDLEKRVPESGRNADMVYHRARAYYYLGYYDEAIVLFKKYADGAGEGGESRKAAAMYWIGECLYSMGQLERAADFFTIVVDRYPGSVKYEAATYRLELVKQKKIESELLTMLKWSHEESLRTVEEYQRREKTYDQALNAYQKRLAEVLKDTQLTDLESANIEYQRQLAEANERILDLEERLASVRSQGLPDELKVKAQQLRNEIKWNLNNLESEDGGYP
ncbi:MAG: tetratricopeptide repeat protein [Treponema sp.]|nr:tetratricopeptide repeat protein [Treponema sp.]